MSPLQGRPSPFKRITNLHPNSLISREVDFSTLKDSSISTNPRQFRQPQPMPWVRALRAGADVGSIYPGNAQGSCNSGRGDVCEHRLNLLYERLGSEPVWEAGRVPPGNPGRVASP